MTKSPTNEVIEENTRHFESTSSGFLRAAETKQEMNLGRCEFYKPNLIGSRPVTTLIRFSPTVNFDHECIKVDKSSNTVDIECTAATGRLLCSKNQTGSILEPMATLNRKYLSFSADKVFCNSSQEDFFTNAVEDLIDKALEGCSGTIIACGAVGSGKTYTLFAPKEKYEYRGVVARTVERVFRTLAEWDERSAVISMSFMEIIGENIVDLLSPKRTPITVVDNGKTFKLKGMSSERVITSEMALVALFRGCAQRSRLQHPRNGCGSSTGHALLTLQIESRSLVETEPFDRYAELTFVDLAGFEKLRSWEHGPNPAIPAAVIDVNKSMTFLEQLIMAMAEKRSYLPVRATKLTHILKNKIGHKCDTRLVACTSGEQCHLAETLATLRFAVRLRGVICKPQLQVIDDPNLMLTKLKKDLLRLQSELHMQDLMAQRAPRLHGELSNQERDIIHDQVELYLDGKLDNIQIVSIKQIEAVLESIKTTQAQRESTLRDQITTDMQQEMQQQLQQLQQQLTAGAQVPAAAENRPSVQQHGRERNSRRKPSRARVGKDTNDDDRATDRSRRDEQRQAAAASADQSGPGFGVGVADGRPNPAAIVMSAKARGGGGGGRGTSARAASDRSPPASVADDAGSGVADVPLPTEARAAGSQEALRQLLSTADGGQLQSELDRWQRTISQQHQQYAALARQLRELRCQQISLQTDLQLQQMERHVQGEQYDSDNSLVLSSDEQQLTVQLRQLSSRLADLQDRLLATRGDLVDAQRQQIEKKSELAAAFADFRLRTNVVPQAESPSAAAAAAGEASGSAAVSAAVQVPPPNEPGSPTAYYSAQRRARQQMRRTRCAK